MGDNEAGRNARLEQYSDSTRTPEYILDFVRQQANSGTSEKKRPGEAKSGKGPFWVRSTWDQLVKRSIQAMRSHSAAAQHQQEIEETIVKINQITEEKARAGEFFTL